MGGTVVPPYMLCGASLMLLATEPPCIERPTCSFIGSIKKLIHVHLATSNSLLPLLTLLPPPFFSTPGRVL